VGELPLPDLRRIGGAHRVEERCVIDPALEQVHPVENLEIPKLEVLPPDVEDVHQALVEDALLLHVVDRQEACRVAGCRVLPVEGVEKHRNGRRVPVVDVNDIGLEAERTRQLQGRAAEQDETAVVVGIPVSAVPVQAAPGVVGIVPDEIDRDPRAGRPPLQHPAGKGSQDAHGHVH